MSEEEKIAAIGKVGDEVSKKVKRIPHQDHFEALMRQKPEPEDVLKVTEVNPKLSPIEELQSASNKLAKLQAVTPDTLVAQAEKAIGTIEGLKRDLKTPDLEIKGSVESLMHNKLVHIDENLAIALSKVGSEIKPKEVLGIAKPIERFIGFLTHSQFQLDTLATDVQMLQENDKNFSAATMLAVQAKVGYIQQELEFFTSLLNKALESTKTIMNVQV